MFTGTIEHQFDSILDQSEIRRYLDYFIVETFRFVHEYEIEYKSDLQISKH